ncbi:MAG TPA: hypothetical protein VFO65_10910 [Acidimicrobiales bacterium]|nr:hypothetical protein [Acidimicrobiales bacterium]
MTPDVPGPASRPGAAAAQETQDTTVTTDAPATTVTTDAPATTVDSPTTTAARSTTTTDDPSPSTTAAGDGSPATTAAREGSSTTTAEDPPSTTAEPTGTDTPLAEVVDDSATRPGLVRRAPSPTAGGATPSRRRAPGLEPPSAAGAPEVLGPLLGGGGDGGGPVERAGQLARPFTVAGLAAAVVLGLFLGLADRAAALARQAAAPAPSPAEPGAGQP